MYNQMWLLNENNKSYWSVGLNRAPPVHPAQKFIPKLPFPSDRVDVDLQSDKSHVSINSCT